MIIARREGRCGVTRMVIRVIIRREIFTWPISAFNILWLMEVNMPIKCKFAASD